MAQSECLTYFIIPSGFYLELKVEYIDMYVVLIKVVFITWSMQCLRISCFRGLVSWVWAACARWPGGGPGTRGHAGAHNGTRNDLTPRHSARSTAGVGPAPSMQIQIALVSLGIQHELCKVGYLSSPGEGFASCLLLNHSFTSPIAFNFTPAFLCLTFINVSHF